MHRWLRSPLGQYLLSWEQECVNEAVGNAFGYHALQVGIPQLRSLQNNRMPFRWQACADAESTDPDQPIHVRCDVDALPFATNSLDLVVLPHTLELSADPHLTLSEVERVLVAQGRLVILGLNPSSLWGLRARLPFRGDASGSDAHPAELSVLMRHALAYRRVRDWLRLLSFEVEDARFGCWRPPTHLPHWLDRMAWMDRVGERWWPVLGSVYFISAVKRVRGMRLVGLSRARAKAPSPTTSAVAQRHHSQTHQDG